MRNSCISTKISPDRRHDDAIPSEPNLFSHLKSAFSDCNESANFHDRLCKLSVLSAPERARTSAEEQAESRRKSGDLVLVEEGFNASEAPIHDETSQYHTDLKIIDPKLDFQSPEGMDDFLKEVIHYLADEDDDASIGTISPTKSTTNPHAAPLVKPSELSSTRIRSKRIAGQRKLTTTSPKKIVEFVSLEEDSESSLTFPLNFRDRPFSTEQKPERLSSDIQKMLLAYSCDSSGNPIVKASRFNTVGLCPFSPVVSPQNPFLFSSAKSCLISELPCSTSPVRLWPQETSKPVSWRKRKRPKGEADPEVIEVISKIGCFSLNEAVEKEEKKIEFKPPVEESKGRSSLIEGLNSSQMRTLRKRENVSLERISKTETMQKPSVTVNNNVISKNLTKRLKLSEVNLDSCRDINNTQRARSQTRQVLKNPNKEVLCNVAKRVKNDSSSSSKENSVAEVRSSWYWPPKLGDMVVGLFEDGWYIGKTLEIMDKGNRVKLKFMEDRNFKISQQYWKWPRVKDIQVLVKCSILNVRPEVKLLHKHKGEFKKSIAGGVYEVTNLSQIQAKAHEFYKRKRPTAPDV